MKKIELIIPGEPIAKARPRVTKYGTYNPAKCVNYETYIKELFVVKYPDFVPMEIALSLELIAYFTIPKSASKKKQRLMRLHIIKPTKKPDLDNCIKIIDALESLAYKNDNQFVAITAKKYYSMRPRLEIRITGV